VRALTFGGGLDLSEGGVYNWQLGSLKDSSDGIAGTDFDQIVLTNGNLALGGSSKLNISFTGAATAPELGEPFWQANRSWTIVNLSETASNSPASNFASLQNASYPAGTFATSVGTNGSIILTFTSASVVNPPHIDAIVVTDRTNATITWSSVSGRMYEVRYNTNLNTTNWTAFTNITAMGGSTTITHIVAAGDAQRYYRVVLLP
jgi:hypothetical protein